MVERAVEESDTSGDSGGLVWILGVPAVVSSGLAVAALYTAAVVVIRPNSFVATTLINTLGTSSGGSSVILPVVTLLVDAAGVTGSLGLSLALAAIYLSQNRILDEQTQIQSTQSKIMRGQHVPAVTAHPDGVTLHAGRPTLDSRPNDSGVETGAGTVELSEGDDGQNWVSVCVENHGDETASQVQMACVIGYESERRDGSESSASGTDGTTEKRLTTGLCDVEVDGMVTDPPRGQGGLLPPNQGLSLLRAKPIFSERSADDNSFTLFVGGLEDELERCEERITFGFVLVFTNAIGELFTLPLDTAYAVDAEAYDESEPLSVARLRELSWEHDVRDLLDDLDWEVPADAFDTR